MTSSKIPVVAQLENIFCRLNEGLFSQTLPMPAHVIEPAKKVFFRFSEESCHVVVGSKFSGNVFRVVEEYLHEMIHMKNMKNGINDTTSNQYHNRNFMTEANRIGLYVTKHKTQGWSLTSFGRPRMLGATVAVPTTESLAHRQTVVAELVKTVNLKTIHDSMKQIKDIIAGNRPNPCFLKYVCKCPPPHNSIRSGRRPNGDHAPQIRCCECGAKFEFCES